MPCPSSPITHIQAQDCLAWMGLCSGVVLGLSCQLAFRSSVLASALSPQKLQIDSSPLEMGNLPTKTLQSKLLPHPCLLSSHPSLLSVMVLIFFP